MSYKFVEKESHRQEEMAYIIYMMVGSYFNRSYCKSKSLESRLFLYYKEMTAKKQEADEERVISTVEKLLEDMKPVLASMNCEVIIKYDDDKLLIDFVTGFEAIHTEIDKAGKYNIVLA